MNRSDPQDQVGGQGCNLTCDDHKTTKTWARNQARKIYDRNTALLSAIYSVNLSLPAYLWLPMAWGKAQEIPRNESPNILTPEGYSGDADWPLVEQRDNLRELQKFKNLFWGIGKALKRFMV